MKKWIFNTGLCLFLSAALLAQDLSVHFDKPYYFSGDYLFMSIQSPAWSTETVTAGIALYDARQTVASYFIQISAGKAAAWIKLPYELASQVYTLRLTTWETDTWQEEHLLHIPVPVYNDAELDRWPIDSTEFVRISEVDLPGLSYTRIPDGRIRCAISREETGTSVNHPISVSIRDAGAFAPVGNTLYHASVGDHHRERTRKLPIHAQRTIVEREGINSPLLFAFSPASMTFDGTRIDAKDGTFTMALTPFFGAHAIYWLDYLQKQIAVTSPEVSERKVLDPTLNPTPAVLRHLRWHREVKQINRVFQQLPITPQPLPLPAPQELPEPDHFLDVPDYDVQGIVRDLMREKLTGLKFKSAGKKQLQAQMLYERNGMIKFYSSPPLFLINNQATRDATLAANLPLQEVKTIRIYSRYDVLQALSPIAFGGLVYIDMKDPYYVVPEASRLPSLSIQGLQTPLQYPVLPVVDDAAPAVHDLLYWNPDLAPVNNEVLLEFTPGSVDTNYLIELAGYDDRAGQVTTRSWLVKLSGS